MYVASVATNISVSIWPHNSASDCVKLFRTDQRLVEIAITRSLVRSSKHDQKRGVERGLRHAVPLTNMLSEFVAK